MMVMVVVGQSVPPPGSLTINKGAQVACPSGWLYNPVHNTCVKVVVSWVTWFEARDQCSQKESTLLHVDSDQMGNFIGKDIKGTGVLQSGTSIWIASNDLGEEGALGSVFRSALSYADWRAGQPNDDTQDGGLHTQNCVMDVVGDTRHQQEDKGCSGNVFPFVCEMWPRDARSAAFVKIPMDTPFFKNYGLGSEAEDSIFPVRSSKACAFLCLGKHFFCEVFVYSSSLRRCQLLRVYESGHAKAVGQVKQLFDEGYQAFALKAFQV
ncbi:low affinity immunoglobulin epsilon Fc receptor-like [Babylonia areolata]|uniref:low affinity immunoglobulin epsilon Fc receptor-like n=1 Tax=Babylonia areolata TaxID=304850 RepID=UPI003FD27AA3